MDDAVHIAAPWEPRSSLCGQHDPANVAPFDGDRPDGLAGCWTCLMAAQWMDRRRLVCDDEKAVEPVAKAICREANRMDGHPQPDAIWPLLHSQRVAYYRTLARAAITAYASR